MEMTVVGKNNEKHTIYLKVQNLAFTISEILENHIGSENAIERNRLFVKLFHRKEEDFKQYERYVVSHIFREAMHFLRSSTRCIPMSRREGWKVFYFIVQSNKDAMYYSDMVNSRIKQFRAMEKRVYKSVEEEWAKNPNIWFTDKQKKAIEMNNKLRLE